MALASARRLADAILEEILTLVDVPCRHFQHENSNHRPAHGGQDHPVHDPDRRPRSDAHRHTAARIGITKVPDARLEAWQLFEPPKVTHATVEYLDFPSISKEALRDPVTWPACAWSTRSRTYCALFDIDTVPHEKGSVDPVRDSKTSRPS